MKRFTLGELVSLSVLQTMADNLYTVAGVPIGILDADGTILIATGWQDICTKFHRANPLTRKRCEMSDQYIKQHINSCDFVSHKCMNHLWDITVPIIVEGEHIASVFLGQFFYENEEVDIDIFINQAQEFGFDEDEYIKAIKSVPVFSEEKVKNILNYYKGLVSTLVESSIAKLQYMRINSKYSRLFNSMQDFVFVLDDTGKFTECNKPMDENLYMPFKEFIGKRFDEVLPSEVSCLFKNAIKRLEYGNGIQPFDYSLIMNNKEMWYSAQVSKVIHEMTGENDSYMVVSRDITERKHIMDELQKAKLQAEEASNAKNAFIANMSHELRTPLTVILSAMQLFEMKMGNDPGIDVTNYNKHLKTVKQNCLRLIRLVNNIIDTTKVDAGFMNLQLQTLNIVNLVEEITVSVAEYAKAKGITVTFDTNTEEKRMAVDPDKIERIMLNILSNAIKFTGKNKSIFVSFHERGNEVFISIKDTGIGIPKEKIGQIFNRFNQIDNTFTKSHEGSGIGLSLVKSFVQMHGGAISVESEPGEGTEFIVKLPVREIESSQFKQYPKYVDNSDFYVGMLNVEFSDIYL